MMNHSTYTVKTQVFEGPLDLLLELVTKRKLFVNDVSLAQVTDDFIRYVAEREEYSLSVPLGESAEFILVASTLMLIKSRSLLPTLVLTEEEEQSIHELEGRLAIYARVKELAANLRALFGKNIIFEKEPSKNLFIVFSPDSKTDKDNLLAALERVIESLPKKEVLPKVVVKKVISLEEMIEKLAERVSRAGKVRFQDLKHKDKISVIVGFLAMLELVKRGAIRVTQKSHSGEIEIESESIGIPHYA
ncbi:MAG: segregation/condensation protein A [Candidatus Zambryskibacteria bacterium]|nr:segregation/condensation protein A [Candidatus Zambryskibacteria bacterium]